jgi:hypothetical protein
MYMYIYIYTHICICMYVFALIFIGLSMHCPYHQDSNIIHDRQLNTYINVWISHL